MTTEQIDALDDDRPWAERRQSDRRRADTTYQDLTEAVLVAHQRLEGGRGCLCGWGELGASHAAHVARVLHQVGALRV